MVLTHQQQQQHLSHLDRVGIYSLSKIQSKVPETPGMGKPKGNPNSIKYQSYTGVLVSYIVKKPKKSWFWWMELELSFSPYYRCYDSVSNV